MYNPCRTQTSIPLDTSCFLAPLINNTFPSNAISMHNSTTLSNISGINFDSTKLFNYYLISPPYILRSSSNKLSNILWHNPRSRTMLKWIILNQNLLKVSVSSMLYATLIPPCKLSRFLIIISKPVLVNQPTTRNPQWAVPPFFHRDPTWIGSVRPGSYSQLSIKLIWLIRSLPTSHFIFLLLLKVSRSPHHYHI